MVVFSCKTCDHSISQAFNGAAARGEAHLARTPDPFEASRAKTIGSTTNIAIGEAHLALFVMWCPGGARSMFRTVSQIRAHRGRCFIVTNTPASTNEGGARSERREEAVPASRKDFPSKSSQPASPRTEDIHASEQAHRREAGCTWDGLLADCERTYRQCVAWLRCGRDQSYL